MRMHWLTYTALLHSERKKLITPIVPDEDTFVRQWEQDEYQPGYFSDEAPFIRSNRGERVRSKSEKIIADKYYKLGIPYKYEKPLDHRELELLIEKYLL